MTEGVPKVNDDNFAAEVENSSGVVLVDFGAVWCPPCKMLEPIIVEVAAEVAGRAKVMALDVDEAGQTAAKFAVMNVPTMIFFKDGAEAKRLVGVSPKEEIVAAIDALLA